MIKDKIGAVALNDSPLCMYKNRFLEEYVGVTKLDEITWGETDEVCIKYEERDCHDSIGWNYVGIGWLGQ